MRPALALIEPDIAGNVGTLIRTAACFGMAVHIVEPCGFAVGDKALRRAGMDYAPAVDVVRYVDRAAFIAAMAAAGRRLVLLTTSGDLPLHDARLARNDVLVLGSEGSGAPDDVHRVAALRVRIPLQPGLRSLNVAVAGGIAMAEALRQTGGFGR